MATSKKTSANTDAIRVIAQEIRDVPKEYERSSPSRICAIAARLLVEALDRGAFSAIEHLTLRALIAKEREPRDRPPDLWEWPVFETAVDWMARRCPDLAKLPRSSLADKCALIASALEAQADKATEATPSAGDADDFADHEQAVHLVVDKAAQSVSFGSRQCTFRASDAFDLIARMARRPNVAQAAKRTAVHRLRQKLRKVEMRGVADAIVAVGEGRYKLATERLGSRIRYIDQAGDETN